MPTTERRSSRRRLAVAAPLAAAACADQGHSGGASDDLGRRQLAPARRQVTIMVGGLNKQIYLPFMLAQQLGYYDKPGVNVKLIDEPAGGDATQNMLAGQVDGVGGFYDHNIALQGQGKSAESVVSMLQIPGEVELCRSDLKGTIKSPADWKGRIARHHRHRLVHRLPHPVPGHQERRRSRRAPHRRGVGAGADLHRRDEAQVHRLRHDDRAHRLAAARQQAPASSCSTCAPPQGATAGPRRHLPGHLAVHDDRLRRTHTRTIVQKLVNAYVKTLKWIQSPHRRRRSPTRCRPTTTPGVGKDAYIKALDSEKGIFNPTGIMPPDGPQTCLKVLAPSTSVKGKSIDLSKTYTDEFVKAATPVS